MEQTGVQAEGTGEQSAPLALGSGLKAGNGLKTGLATAAVVGVGAALIEVEWIPGLLLGVAAMVAPGIVPKIGRGIRPFVHSAIKGGYAATRKTREWAAEAGEQVSDMIAEVRSSAMENDSHPTAATPVSATPVSRTESQVVVPVEA